MDLLTLLKFAAALGLVLSLIGGCAFLASRLNLVSNLSRKPEDRRMRVVESLVLDAKHRMMIVESGEREHVLLYGPSGDLIVESREAVAVDKPDLAKRGFAAQTIVPLVKEGMA